jgi:multicomponent Na+:H+ antiporter subunit G
MGFVDITSWILLVAGGIVIIIGGIGLLRLPDVYSRMHAAGMTDTLGAMLIISGLVVQSGWDLNSARLLIILSFILFTSPASTHALAKAALHGGIQPQTSPDVESTP